MSNGQSSIFQQFILDSDGLMKEKKQDGQLAPCQRWAKIEHALRAYGFSLMRNQTTAMGVPCVIIVGMPVDCMAYLSTKTIFYELTSKYNLSFGSGDCYTGEFGSSMWENMLADKNNRAFIELMADEEWFIANHGKWAGFFNGKFVAADDDQKKLNDHLEFTYKNQEGEGLICQVLTREEEEKRAIQLP
jgi:hypothetical protein